MGKSGGVVVVGGGGGGGAEAGPDEDVDAAHFENPDEAVALAHAEGGQRPPPKRNSGLKDGIHSDAFGRGS